MTKLLHSAVAVLGASAALALCGLAPCAARADGPIEIVEPQRSEPVVFEKDVLPIFRKNCLACHSASEAQGELVLETAQSVVKEGDRGPTINVKAPDASLLLVMASHRKEPFMPPPDNDVAAKPLSGQELGLIRLWIKQGAQGSASGGPISPARWRPLPPGVHPIYAAAITSDGQFAACGRANQIFIYHVPTGQLVTRLTDPALAGASGDNRPGIAHLDIVQSLAFNREGDLLATGGFRVAKLWRRPRDVQRLKFALGDVAVTALAVSPDGATAALATADHQIALCDVQTGEPRQKLAGHADAVTCLRFSASGDRLFSASLDKSIRIWRLPEGTLIGRIDTPAAVNAIALPLPEPPPPLVEGQPPEVPEPRPEHIASGGADNFVRLWRVPDRLSRPLPADILAKANVLAVTPDRKLLALANAEGMVQLVDAEDSTPLRSWQAQQAAIADMAFGLVPPPPSPPAADQQQAAQQDAAPRPPRLMLATAAADGAVRLWDCRSGELNLALRGGLTPVTAVAFSPTGKQLVCAGTDGRVTSWSLEAPLPRALEPGGELPPRIAAVSPDGKLLATAGISAGRPAILVRDVAAGKIVQTLLGHEATITALAFGPGGARIVSGSQDKTVRVWELADGKVPQIARLAGHEQPITAVAMSADQAQVLSGGADGSVKLWNLADEKELMAFAGHTGAIVAVGMAAGNQPLSASADKTVRIWNAADGKQVRAFNEAQPITAAALTPDGARIALATADNSIKLLQVADGKLLYTVAGHEKPAFSLAFSPDAARLISASADQRAMVWNTANGRLLEILPVEAGLALAAFGPTAATVLLGDDEGAIELGTLNFAAHLDAFKQPIVSLAYRPDGQLVYAASAEGLCVAFNVANGQPAVNFNHGKPLHAMAIRPDGQIVATGGEDNRVKLWNAANGQPAQSLQLEAPAPIHALSFSPSGARLIAATSVKAAPLLVYNVAAGELEQSLPGHEGTISALAVLGEVDDRVVSAAPDQDVRTWQLLAVRRLDGHKQPVTAMDTVPNAPMQVVSGSEDGILRQWNLATGQVVRELNHQGPIRAVAFQPQGKRLAAAGDNNVIRLWNAENNQQVAELKGDLRAKTVVAQQTQEEKAYTAKVKDAGDVLAAAEKDSPVKAEAAKKAAAALAAADKDVAEKTAALDKVAKEKAAAEKVAIEMAAAAQKAAAAKAAADQLIAQTAAAAKLAAEKAVLAQSLAQSNPDRTDLAQAATTAQAAADAAKKAAEAAVAAKAAPEKAAADAAAKAQDAAAKAVATNKPFLDANSALAISQATQKLAAQTAAIAQREATAATEAIPAAKADVESLQAQLKQIQAALQAAQKAATEAEQPILALAFSADGTHLASSGNFATIHSWDAETGAAVACYAGHQGPVSAVVFGPEGTLLSAAADKTAVLWELNPGWKLERVIGSIDDTAMLSNRVVALDFSPDGTLLAAGSGEPSRSGEIKIFNVADGALKQTIADAHADSVFGIDFSPDGRLVASAGADKYVRIFEVATGKLVQSLEGHTDHVLGVSWRSDGKVLASCGADRTVRTWNALNGDRIRTIGGFGKQVSSVRFVGESHNTLAAGGDKLVRLQNTDNGQTIRNYPGSEDFVYSADATPDGAIVVAGGYDSALRIWQGNNNQLLHTLAPPADESGDEPADKSTEQAAAK